MATVDDPEHLNPQWKAACEEGDADQLWRILQQASAQTATLAVVLDKSDTAAGFQVACRRGHVKLMQVLLALTGDLVVDVHAADERGPEAAFRDACRNGHTDVVRELLALTGAREVENTLGPAGHACGMRDAVYRPHALHCALAVALGLRPANLHHMDFQPRRPVDAHLQCIASAPHRDFAFTLSVPHWALRQRTSLMCPSRPADINGTFHCKHHTSSPRSASATIGPCTTCTALSMC